MIHIALRKKINRLHSNSTKEYEDLERVPPVQKLLPESSVSRKAKREGGEPNAEK